MDAKFEILCLLGGTFYSENSSFQHDTTIAALLTTFGDEQRVIRGGLPRYTASLALELWNIDGLGPAVKVR